MTTYQKLTQLLSSQERRQMILLLFPMLIGMGLEIIGISMVIPVIMLMTQPDFGEIYPIIKSLLALIGHPTQTKLVIGGMLGLVAIYIIKTLFLIFMSWKQNKFIFGVQANLSSRLFKGYLLQPWSFHLQRNSAQLIFNATNEVNLYINNALQPYMLLLTEGLMLLGIVTLLFIIEPVGALAVVSVLGLAALGFQRLFRHHLLRWGEARQHHEGACIQHLQQGLGGAKDVKLLGREHNFFTEYNAHNLGRSSVGQKQKTLLELPRLWLELLAIIGMTALVGLMLLQGKSLSTLLPVLALFATAAFRLMPSVNRVLGAFQSLRYGLPVINNLHQEIMLLDEGEQSQRNLFLSFRNKITLQHVAYRYTKAHTQALKDVTLTIHHGTSVGFIGSSGAGKSTLVDIILGLLTPDKGFVKIDGLDIQSNLRGWQDQIGYVPQSIFLTDDTLRRNVAFGLSDELIDNLAVQRAIKSAQLDDYVSSLPQGLETLVGERGVRLSGGQRQRIGIARALYHDPAVLVLDEATSSLDIATEKGVMDAINALHGRKTILIVAHRLSTIANCDLLYRMEEGQIIEEKNFENLVGASLVS